MKKILVVVGVGLMAAAGYAATTADLDVDATVGAGVSDIVVAPGSLSINDGAAITATRTTHRYWSNIATCDYFFANAAAGWYVKVYSDKTGADGEFGTLQTTGGDNMELRIWHPGYGPNTTTYPGITINNPPDLHAASFWDAKIGGVDNADMCVLKMASAGGTVIRYLAFDANVGGFTHAGDPTAAVLPFRLAVEAAGCPVGSYGGTVTFEMVIP